MLYMMIQHFFFKYIPQKNSLKVIVEQRCFIHNIRNIDELWSLEILLPYSEWSDFLTEFGKEKLKN